VLALCHWLIQLDTKSKGGPLERMANAFQALELAPDTTLARQAPEEVSHILTEAICQVLPPSKHSKQHSQVMLVMSAQ
jgi:hypothetical protein